MGEGETAEEVHQGQRMEEKVEVLPGRADIPEGTAAHGGPLGTAKEKTEKE